MKTDELIAKISDLPVEERANAVDQILQTFNQTDPEIEKAWAKEAQRRLKEFENGDIEAIPGEQFDREVQEMKEQFSE